MPTVCELKIEAKKRGLKGYSVMKKAELENLLAGAGGAGSSEKKETPPKKIKKIKMNIKRPKPTEAPKPKDMSKFKPQEIPAFKTLSEDWRDFKVFGQGGILELNFDHTFGKWAVGTRTLKSMGKSIADQLYRMKRNEEYEKEFKVRRKGLLLDDIPYRQIRAVARNAGVVFANEIMDKLFKIAKKGAKNNNEIIERINIYKEILGDSRTSEQVIEKTKTFNKDTIKKFKEDTKKSFNINV